MRRRTAIAYWLTPAEPARSFFQGVINDLALRYDAPLFEPHVTLHVGADRADAAEKALRQAARVCQRIKLKAVGIDHSGEFTKTLFVQFAISAGLVRLNEIIRHAGGNASQYELQPHLSLLYKKMAASTRRLLARSIELPFSTVTFDSLRAVRCVSPTQSGADVEAWRVVASEKLRAGGPLSPPLH
jgi:2'-5' RNA ligase